MLRFGFSCPYEVMDTSVWMFVMRRGTPRSIDLTGQKFGRLTVIELAPREGSAFARWACICDCGAEKVVRGQHLRSGTISSCGCYQRECASKMGKSGNGRITHGEGSFKRQSPEYTSWRSMIERCRSPNSTGWHRYGGRGISVCDRWHSFENFLADMGRKPSPHHSIDRIDNDGNYEPENCRWATNAEQLYNRSCTRRIEYRGQSLTIMEASRISGLPSPTIKRRVLLGWDPIDVIEKPLMPRGAALRRQ